MSVEHFEEPHNQTVASILFWGVLEGMMVSLVLQVLCKLV